MAAVSTGRTFVAWLKGAYQEITWEEALTTGRRLWTEPWFRIADRFGSIVDEAIRRTEEATRRAEKNLVGQ